MMSQRLRATQMTAALWRCLRLVLLVVGAGVGVVLGGDEGCLEHGVFESVVAASGFSGGGAGA